MVINLLLILLSCLTTSLSQIEEDIKLKAESEIDFIDEYPDFLYPAEKGFSLISVFVIFRHGDRTPDQEELNLLPQEKANWTDVFFPYGMRALTNKGRMTGYKIGECLRNRYNGFLSKLYLPGEIQVTTTNYARTKMTALALLAALYKPMPLQKWHPNLDWQPVPFSSVDMDDPMLYWINCERYLWRIEHENEDEDVKRKIQPYRQAIAELRRRTAADIYTPENVYNFDNLLQALNNVGYPIPTWTHSLMPQIKELTKLAFAIENKYDLLRMTAGVLLNEIVNATSAAIHFNVLKPKLRLYSAHENNVAALMAAVGVFKPHQPRYGATFALELRRHKRTGKYGMMAVYYPKPGKQPTVLPMYGCGGAQVCPYKRFLELTKNILLRREDYKEECSLY